MMLLPRSPVQPDRQGSEADRPQSQGTPLVEVPAEADRPYVAIIGPSSGGLSDLARELWCYRELLYFLVWRDLKVRYKQTFLGVAWVVIQPVTTMVIFSLLFGRLLKVPSGGVPYPIFTYAALLPWNYFAQSLTRSSGSVVASAHLITKVYFPRLVTPLSGTLAGLLDFAVAFLVLLGLMAYYRVKPTPAIVLLPGFLALAALTALGFALWLSALNVRFRDVNYLVPFLVQTWMYATPVVYGSTLIPERFRPLIGVNPMSGVVEGFRWALLGNHLADAHPPGTLFAISVAITLAVLSSGFMYFRATERTFADII